MDRSQKEQQVAALNEIFSGVNLLVVARPIGLSVAEATDLRRQMRDAGACYKVTKNRLTRLALKGTRFEPLTELFVGPTAIAFSDDLVAAAKVTVGFAAKNGKLTILGGALEDQILDVAAVSMLAKLPSLDELRAQFLGLLNTPATRIAGILQAPAGQVARVVNAYSASGGTA